VSINGLSVDLGRINCTGPCTSKQLQTLGAIELELLPSLMKTHSVSSTLEFHPECCNECSALSWSAVSRSIGDETPIFTNTSICNRSVHPSVTLCHMQQLK